MPKISPKASQWGLCRRLAETLGGICCSFCCCMWDEYICSLMCVCVWREGGPLSGNSERKRCEPRGASWQRELHTYIYYCTHIIHFINLSVIFTCNSCPTCKHTHTHAHTHIHTYKLIYLYLKQKCWLCFFFFLVDFSAFHACAAPKSKATSAKLAQLALGGGSNNAPPKSAARTHTQTYRQTVS